MTWLQLWTAGLTATVALCVLLAVAEDSGLPADIVKKESHPVLFRQKREWLWNSLYVEEEKPAPVPYKIGQLRSSLKADVNKYEIYGEGANTIFQVDTKGDLFVTRALDRETKSSYSLQAKMFDGNRNVVEQAGNFIVHVTDINDNRPFFNTTFTGEIKERSPEGTEVIRVIAYDADDPTTANGELRYSMRDNFFTINGETGWISCQTRHLDRETMSQYVVVVKAQDMRGMDSGSTATTSVTINIEDINDNLPSFPQRLYKMSVPEDFKPGERIGVLRVDDRDSTHNKNPDFTIRNQVAAQLFDIVLNQDKDGSLMLKKPLDYETTSSYNFIVDVRETLNARPDNQDIAVTSATVSIEVMDVNEPPVFGQHSYSFTVVEEQLVDRIGRVKATDPDSAKQAIRYSINDCPISINPSTGELSTLRKLDREREEQHKCEVKAQEVPNGLESFAEITIKVKDINDNEPQLVPDDLKLCEGDVANTVVGRLNATDDDNPNTNFTFRLKNESSNFSIVDHGNNMADVVLKMGPFSMDDPKDYSVDVVVSDGHLTSVTTATIKSCRCGPGRVARQCKAGAQRMGVSVHALIAILLCILTILVIVILFVMRKRYQKDSLASMKNSGEIHEQLVTYDEEGGGEMDTNGYDVSILSSACHDGSLLRHPDQHPHPSLYAMVQKAPHHSQPTACKGDMAVMIEVKKEEADHDRDGFPYDTLHIYGYEGPESLAGSLSSLDSSSTGSNLDYDFLNDWGPRFRTLAELYGVDEPEYYHQY